MKDPGSCLPVDDSIYSLGALEQRYEGYDYQDFYKSKVAFVKMPHELSSSTMQAIILCGPGVSLAPFTSSPEEFPKALLPIANRPMVWYPLQWCHRAGISHVSLIIHSSSAPALRSAMASDPYLTSYTPRIISPKDLSHNSGTAEILRMPEVVSSITADFVVLPCDFVTDIDGTALVEHFLTSSLKHNLKGGLGLWYQAKGPAASKGEEPDFIATTRLTEHSHKCPGGMGFSRLVMAMPGDALGDVLDEEAGLKIRNSLLSTNPSVRLLTSCRDAHVYFFPRWVMDFINKNERTDSLSEDVIGLWAKASWQPSLAADLGLEDLAKSQSSDIDRELASLLTGLKPPSHTAGPTPITAPSFVAAIQSQVTGKSPMIRRVDTPALLLSMSLQIAKLQTLDEVAGTANPLAHSSRISSPKMVAPRCNVGKTDCLLGHQADVQEKSSILNSVIGPGVVIGPGCRIINCVIMERANIGPGCYLDNTVIGRQCNIGPQCRLKNCVVQDRYNMQPGTEANDQVFSTAAGLEEWPDENEMMDDEI